MDSLIPTINSLILKIQNDEKIDDDLAIELTNFLQNLKESLYHFIQELKNTKKNYKSLEQRYDLDLRSALESKNQNNNQFTKEMIGKILNSYRYKETDFDQQKADLDDIKSRLDLILKKLSD